MWIDKYDKNKYIKEEDDFIIAQGGDGTLLRAIQMFKHKDKPFFGIAAGTSNFLMNNEKNISKTPKIKTFNLIKAKVIYLKKDRDMSSLGDKYVERTKEFQVFNDVMIGGDMNSWIDFNVIDKDKIIGSFKGGGIIFSTSQGSTGINKNNNGPILPLSSNNWSVTGDKTNKKINYVIEARKTIIECSSRNPVTVWLDGQNNVVTNVIKVGIDKGQKVKLVFNDYDSFKIKRS